MHGTGAIPGGVNKSLAAADRATLLKDIYQMIAWSREAVQIIKQLHEQNPALYDAFGDFRANFMSIVAPDGGMDFYDGALRARDADGRLLFDKVYYEGYTERIEEEVRAW